MDCIELVELVTDYLEGTLPHADHNRFEAHLRECPYCYEYLRQMRATLFALGRIPAESVSPTVQERLLLAFRSWRRD
ncbi:MAG TPA: zf-HC2 domain-containing protein [Candidatus Cybelea sp.]|jgi:anti-sigma factor RsiW